MKGFSLGIFFVAVFGCLILSATSSQHDRNGLGTEWRRNAAKEGVIIYNSSLATDQVTSGNPNLFNKPHTSRLSILDIAPASSPISILSNYYQDSIWDEQLVKNWNHTEYKDMCFEYQNGSVLYGLSGLCFSNVYIQDDEVFIKRCFDYAYYYYGFKTFDCYDPIPTYFEFDHAIDYLNGTVRKRNRYLDLKDKRAEIIYDVSVFQIFQCIGYIYFSIFHMSQLVTYFGGNQWGIALFSIVIIPIVEEQLKINNSLYGYLYPLAEMIYFLYLFKNRLSCTQLYILAFGRFVTVVMHFVSWQFAFRSLLTGLLTHIMHNFIAFIGPFVFSGLPGDEVYCIILFSQIGWIIGSFLFFRQNIVIRQTKKCYQREVPDNFLWHYDSIDFKHNQRNERVYRLRRTHSDGFVEFGPWRDSILKARDDFISRQSGSIRLQQIVVESGFLEKVPEMVQVVTLLANLYELRIVKAHYRAYITAIGSSLINWLAYTNRTQIRDYLCIILGALTNSSLGFPNLSGDQLDEEIDVFLDTKEQMLGPTILTDETLNELSMHGLNDIKTSEIIRQARENKDDDAPMVSRKPKFFRDLIIVGSTLFGIATLPTIFDVTRVRNHLSCVDSERFPNTTLNSVLDLSGLLGSFVSSAYSLFTSAYLSTQSGDILGSFFNSRIRKEYDLLCRTHLMINDFDSSMEHPGAPYTNLLDYEFALRKFKQQVECCAILSVSEKRSYTQKVQIFLDELSNGRFRNRPRKSPFVLTLFGESGIGKSSLCNYVLGLYADTFNINTGSHVCERVYRHNPACKHWDGCQSTHWAYILDDVARERDATKNANGASNEALLDICGNLPFFPPMAAVEQKAQVSCNPRLCLLTTNIKSLNAHQNFAVPVALQRRVHFYITPTVVPEFQTPSGFLDSHAMRNLPSYVKPWVWRFCVEEPVKVSNPSNPIVGDHITYRPVKFRCPAHKTLDLNDFSIIDVAETEISTANMDWAEFSIWMRMASIEFDENQKSVVDSMMNDANNMRFCSHCKMTHTFDSKTGKWQGSFPCQPLSEECIMKVPPIIRQSGEEFKSSVLPRSVVIDYLATFVLWIVRQITYPYRIFRLFLSRYHILKRVMILFYSMWVNLRTIAKSFYMKHFGFEAPLWYDEVITSVTQSHQAEIVARLNPLENLLNDGFELNNGHLSDLKNLRPMFFLLEISRLCGRALIFSDGVQIGVEDFGIMRLDMECPIKVSSSMDDDKYYFLLIIVALLLMRAIPFYLLLVFSFLIYKFQDSIYNRFIHYGLQYSFGCAKDHFVRHRMKYLIGILLVTLTILYTFQYTNSKSRQGGEGSKERSWWQPITDNGLYNKEPSMSQQSRAAMPGIDNITSNYKAFLQLVRRNILYIDLRRSGTSTATCQHCLAIDNDHIIINEHALRSRSGEPFDEIVIYRRNLGVRQQIGFYRISHLHSTLIHPDVRLFHIPQPLQCKDIKSYFHKQDWTALTGGVRLGYSNWRSYENPTKENPILEVETHSDYGAIKVINNETYWVFSKCIGKTDFGDCGSPWVSKSATGAVIFGIHGGALGADPFFSDNRDRFACRITYEDLLKGLAQVKPFGLITQNCNDIRPESLFYDTQGNSSYNLSMVEPICHKAQAFWIDHTSKGEDRFCGVPHYTLQKVMQNHSTEFGFFSSLNYWLEKGVKIDKYPPSYAYDEETDSIKYVSQTIPRSLTKSSYYLGITEIHEMARTVNVKLLDMCGKHYVECVLKRLPDGWESEIKKYTTFEAVYGILGVQYVDAMNFSTSFGFPVNKKKSFCLGFNDSKPMEIPDWLRDRINFLEDQYSKGSRCNPVFTSHLKDEFISEKKLKAQRLRVFMGSPCDFTIVSRKYLLSFVRLMQLHRFCFECAVAIRAQSLDWSDLYDYLTWNGRITKFIAGDYKFFDKAMHFYVLAVASSVVISIIRASGQFSENDINICKLILLDIINCVVNYDGSIMELFGTNPSGHALTVILNCIVGSIYVRYAFFIKFGKLDLFEEQIRLVTYGDDNGIGVDDSCSFTFTDMKTGIAELSTYTTADKKDVGPDHEPIDKISFLQRGFLENEFLSKIFNRRVFTAPLNEASIHKMLIGGRKTLPDLACISTGLKTAIREYAFHSEHKYSDWSVKIADCAKHFYLSDYVPRTQEEWLLRWFRDDICREIDKNIKLGLPNSYLDAANEVLRGLDNSGEGFISLSEEVVRETGLSTWVVQPFKMPAAHFLQQDLAPTDEVSIVRSTTDLIHVDHIGDLGSFLQRPIKIATINWVEGNSVRRTIYPLRDFMATQSVKNKILNYSKFRGDLKLEFFVNSNPFKFGSLIAAWKPLVSYGRAFEGGSGTPTVTSSEYADASGGVIDDDILKTANIQLAANLMQRQHVMIYPQQTTKVEMIIPFVWLQDFIPMVKNDTYDKVFYRFGKLDFCSLVDLGSSAEPTVSPITIEVFASIVNPILCGPSLQREADEYDSDKPISSTMSAMAEASGALSVIPSIKPFAIASQMTFSALGSLARWFGFSNPINIENANRMKPIMASDWAITEGQIPMAKLALDPKNEITIDPSVLGAGKDDMMIEDICSKPFLFGVPAWNDEDTAGTIIASGICAPAYFMYRLFQVSAQAAGTEPESLISSPTDVYSMTMAPATWVAQNFNYWRGDMRLHFKVLCSQFHRGRLRFIYDPAGRMDTFSEGKVFSKIIDLTHENDATIDIPYMGFRPFIEHPRFETDPATGLGVLQTNVDYVYAFGSAVNDYYDVAQHFGSWQIQVLTELSCPLNSTAYVQCEVSFHNNHFMCPTKPYFNASNGDGEDIPAWSYKAPLEVCRQSQEFESSQTIIDKKDLANKVALLCGGEACHSIRQLLHRWNCHSVRFSSIVSNLCNSYNFSELIHRFPIYHGSNRVASDQIYSDTGTLAGGYNPTVYYEFGGCTYLNYFTPAYTARRGSINWRFILTPQNVDPTLANSQNTARLIITNANLSRYLHQYEGFGGGVGEGFREYFTFRQQLDLGAQDTYVGGAATGLRANQWKRQRILLADASYPLQEGAEVCSELSSGVIQQVEASFPDYNPDRAHPANPYQSDSIEEASESYDGEFLAYPCRRDAVLINGEATIFAGQFGGTIATREQESYIQSKNYCCAGSDFQLLGFLNVPTMYIRSTLLDIDRGVAINT